VRAGVVNQNALVAKERRAEDCRPTLPQCVNLDVDNCYSVGAVSPIHSSRRLDRYSKSGHFPNQIESDFVQCRG